MNIDVKRLLVAAGYSNVYAIDPLDTINDYILVSDSGGFGLTTEDAGFSRPSIQIIIADKNYITLASTIKSIRAYLASITQEEIRDALSELYEWDDWTLWTLYSKWDTYLYKDDREVYDDKTQGFDISSDVLELGRDEQLRYMKSINFTVFSNID